MGVIKIILIAIALVSVAVFGLAVRIVLLKGGKFPETHVGKNREMKKYGIVCVKTYDKIEQNKARKEQKFKDLKVAN